MRECAPADSSARTRLGSSWFSLQAKLRMIVRQNARRRHVELKDLQLPVLLYLVDELVGQRGRTRFAVHGNLPSRLAVGGNANVRRRKALEKIQQNFHRVIARIDSGSERLPVRLRGPDECGLRRIARNASIKTPNFKVNGGKGSETEKENSGVNGAGPEK